MIFWYKRFWGLIFPPTELTPHEQHKSNIFFFCFLYNSRVMCELIVVSLEEIDKYRKMLDKSKNVKTF